MSSILGRSLLGSLILASEDDGGGGSDFSVSAISAISLSQTLAVIQPYYAIATSTLSLTADTLQRAGTVRGASQITLTQVADQHGPITKDASNTLTLTDGTAVHPPISKSTSSTLAMSNAAEAHGPITKSAASTITLVSIADLAIKLRSATSTLEFVDVATGSRVLRAYSVLELLQSGIAGEVHLAASNDLELSDVARRTNITIRVPSSELFFEQTVTSNIKMLSATSTLELVQTEDVRRPWYRTATSPLIESTEVFNPTTFEFDTVFSGLSQSVSLTAIVTNSAHHIIPLIDFAIGYNNRADGIECDATSTLSLVSTGLISIPEDAENELLLSQTAIPSVAKYRPRSSLTITQSVSVNVLRAVFETSSELGLHQATAYVLETPHSECTYSPFIGGNDDPSAPTPPSATLGCVLSGQDVFRLVYPPTGAVAESIVLRNPTFGNLDRLAFDRINRETRGGTLVIFADPIWPKIQTLVLTFSGLKRGEAHNLVEFMDTYLGQEIGMIDWEHRFWKGVIVNPENPIVEDFRGSYTASFEFEGALSEWTEQTLPDPETCSGYVYGTPRVRGPARPVSCCDDGPVGGGGTVEDSNEAETDSDTLLGQPVYITAAGHAELAQANGAGTVGAVGLAAENADAGASLQYLTEGKITRTDWTSVAGTATLSAGARYYLSATTAGRITVTAPTTVGQYVLKVGRAISTTVLDIEIDDSIKL